MIRMKAQLCTVSSRGMMKLEWPSESADPQKEMVKLYTTGAICRSVLRHFLQDAEVKRCMVVLLRPDALTPP